MRERHNSIANTLQLHLSCTNPSICEQIESETVSLEVCPISEELKVHVISGLTYEGQPYILSLNSQIKKLTWKNKKIILSISLSFSSIVLTVDASYAAYTIWAIGLSAIGDEKILKKMGEFGSKSWWNNKSQPIQPWAIVVLLRYSVPSVLVYHSKYVFQILWKKIKVLKSFSKHHEMITWYPNYIFLTSIIFFWSYLLPWQPCKIWFF